MRSELKHKAAFDYEMFRMNLIMKINFTFALKTTTLAKGPNAKLYNVYCKLQHTLVFDNVYINSCIKCKFFVVNLTPFHQQTVNYSRETTQPLTNIEVMCMTELVLVYE